MIGKEVILITGTSRGIGNHLARWYVAKGYFVVGCSRGKVDFELDNYVHFIIDITKEEEVRKMVSNIYEKYGRIDILVNNAGVFATDLCLLTTMKNVKNIFETNFIATFVMCREVGKIMMRRKYGRIVNIGTVAIPIKIEGESIYAASKNAVITFTQILAKELSKYNITCNIISPSVVKTEMIKNVPEEKIKKIIDGLAIKRFCGFEDIANAVDFFIKKESSYVTGQVIYLGGGG